MTVLERLWKEVVLPRLKLPPRDLPGGKQKVGEGQTSGRDSNPQIVKKKLSVNHSCEWLDQVLFEPAFSVVG